MPQTALRSTSFGRRSSCSRSVRVLQPSGIAGVAVVELVVELVAGDRDLLRVDDDDEVAGVDVRRELRLALAAQPVGDLGREPAEGLALGVDEVPLARDLARLGAVGLHVREDRRAATKRPARGPAGC